METDGRTGIDKVLKALEESLARAGTFKLISIRRDVRFEPGTVDADCSVQWSGGQLELLLTFHATGQPGMIRRVAAGLRAYDDVLAGSTIIPVFAAPYISDDGMEICRQAGIGCIDEAGNCLLGLAGAYIEIRGRKNPRPEARSIKSLFSPKSSRIIRALVSDPERWWQVQELAATADISLGLVSRLKQRLLEEDLVIERERRIRVRSPKKMIDDWTTVYRYKRNRVAEFYSQDDIKKVESDVASWCDAHDVAYALAMFSAARCIAPHVRMNKTFLFVDKDPDTVASALGFHRVSSGANVVLLQPFDASVFFDARECEGLRIVSAIQTYLDLKTYRGRGEEAADFLMEHVLEKQWTE